MAQTLESFFTELEGELETSIKQAGQLIRQKSGETPKNQLIQGPQMIRQGLIQPRAFTTEREARKNDLSTDDGRESMQFMATMERIFGG